jgi:hypothetical protein
MEKCFKQIVLIITLGLVLATGVFTGCNSDDGFRIVLTETGEVVLSTEHIKSYDADTYTLELNGKGIERWNSFLDYTSGSTSGSLYGKEFAVELNGQELYRGKFYSMISSATYDGVVILDAIMKRNAENDTLQIEFGYPNADFTTGEDPRDNARLLKYFKEQELLK